MPHNCDIGDKLRIMKYMENVSVIVLPALLDKEDYEVAIMSNIITTKFAV